MGLMDNKAGAEIIHWKDLEPKWHVPGAKEPGFMRYLVNWVGGPKGSLQDLNLRVYF
jgi:hypothetical protein